MVDRTGSDVDRVSIADRQDILAELGQRALATEEIDRVLDPTLTAVVETLDAECGAVLELLPDERELLLRDGTGWSDEAVGSATAPAEPGSQTGYTLTTETPVIFDDLSGDRRFSGPELLLDRDIESGISVIVGPVADPWGILGVYTTDQRDFSEADAAFLRRVANILAAAIDRTDRDRDRERALDLFEKTERIAEVGGWEIDTATNDVYWTDHLHELLGVPKDEEPSLDEALDVYHEDDRGSIEAAIQNSIDTGDPFDVEARFWTTEGELRWLHVQGTPVKEDGQTVALRGAAQDVTEREERKRGLEEYRALTEAAKDVIITIDDESKIRSVNPAVEDMFGYDPSTLVGEPLATLMPDGFPQQHEEAFQRYMETGERTLDWSYTELPGKCSDGSTVPLGISFSEIEHNGQWYFTGIIRDITQRKEYERKLEASHERLEQFANAVSHDVKKPLGTVASYLQLLDQRYTNQLDDEAKEFIDFAAGSATRTREMIDGIVSEYAHIDSRGEEFEPVDLNDVVDHVLIDLQTEIEGTDADITAAELPQVRGDPTQIHQLLMNLLDNAIKYSGDEPPQIHISAEREGDSWVVSVADRGIGIDPDATEAVFDVFHRLHDDETYPGVGIGLALCQRIVVRHGGEIWVESEPGVGSTFSFTLPPLGE